MNLSDTDQAPYSAPAPQTATVSDEAVQVGINAYYGSEDSHPYDMVRGILTAALPHLALSAAPCSVEAKKLTFAEIAALEEKSSADDRVLTYRQIVIDDLKAALIVKSTDVAAERERCAEVADKAEKHWLKKRDATANKKESRDYETMAIAAMHVATAIRALSHAEPVDQWQDIATAPKDGAE